MLCKGSCTSRLPASAGGGVYMVSNPGPSACPYSPCPFGGGGKWPNYRDPLVISIARDGLNFSRHWVVRTAQLPPTPGGVGGPPSLLNCSWPGHQHGGSGCRPG